jgi:hypothetical protein
MAYGVDVEVPDLRVVVRRPDVIVNTSLIPIQPVAEFALTASYAKNVTPEFTGSVIVDGDVTVQGFISASSITGSFQGDGSQLTGLVTDLRLSGSSGNDTIQLLTDDLTILGANGIETLVTNNTLTIVLPDGTVSSSTQAETWSVATASYAQTVKGLNVGQLATTGSNVFVGDQVITGSVESNEFKLTAGDVTLDFTGSITTGLFGVSVDIEPPIPLTKYSGASIEYVAQRPGATRMGYILSAWLNSGSISFTEVSTADVGDTRDLTFTFLATNGNFRLRVTSAGLGSGTWTIQSLFKLFPNLHS